MNAAQIMGLRVAGVDMLESDHGPLVMEVNSSPGLEGIEGATGLDIAGVIVDYMASQVAFPELDIRQRLSTSANYGVTEIAVHEGAAVLSNNMTIGDLRESDIAVLTLPSGWRRYPEPQGEPGPRSQRPPRVLRQARSDASAGARASTQFGATSSTTAPPPLKSTEFSPPRHGVPPVPTLAHHDSIAIAAIAIDNG